LLAFIFEYLSALIAGSRSARARAFRLADDCCLSFDLVVFLVSHFFHVFEKAHWPGHKNHSLLKTPFFRAK